MPKMKRNGLLAWTMRAIQMLGVFILLLVLWGAVSGHMPPWPYVLALAGLSIGLVLWTGRGYIWGPCSDEDNDEFDGDCL